MGFFKNLFKGKFKAIGKNFVNNVSEGRLIKGAGFLDGIVNNAVDTVTIGGLKKVGDFLPDRLGSALLGGKPKMLTYQPHKFGLPQMMDFPVLKEVPLTKTEKVESTAKIQSAVKANQITPTEASKLIIDIGNAPEKESDNSAVIYVALAAIALWFINKKK